MLTTLDATSDSIFAEGIATEPEIAAARENLAAFTDDPATLISGPRLLQVWARKATG